MRHSWLIKLYLHEVKWNEVPQSCPTLCDPVNWSPPGSSVLGILQARILEWVGHFLLQGNFPTQGSNPGLLHCRQTLNLWATREHVWNVSIYTLVFLIFPGGVSGKEPTCQCRRHKKCGFNPWVRKISWRRAWQHTPVYLPGKFHGQRSLASCSP